MNLAFTELEYELLRAAAEPMAPGAWASEQVLQVARGVVVPVPTGEREALRLLAEARVAVNRIGTNLNQLVAAANAAVVAGDDPASAVSGEQLAAVLARVQVTLQRVDAATVAVMGR